MVIDFHLHIPEGAVPKDGPSAGITMAVVLASAFTKRSVRGDIAMTGEVTLRGEVLPIGGLREKLMAALRGGLSKVIIPEKNRRELAEVPDEVKNPLEIISVKTVEDVFEIMLRPMDVPKKRKRTSKTKPRTTTSV